MDLISIALTALLSADGGVEIQTDASVQACVDGLLIRAPKLVKSKSIIWSLRAIGSSCQAMDKTLAKAATKASYNRRRTRAKILAGAQTMCVVIDANAAAETMVNCIAGAGDPQGPVLRDIDAGSYAFLKSFRAQIEKNGTLPAHVDGFLNNLALSLALEGEAARAK